MSEAPDGTSSQLNPALSDETSRRCQAAITERLASMLGEEGVEILTEYIWHMITRPRTTRDHVCGELQEFLGQETEAFVEWLIETVGPIINRELPEQHIASAPEPHRIKAEITEPQALSAPTEPIGSRRILNMAVRQATAAEPAPPPESVKRRVQYEDRALSPPISTDEPSRPTPPRGRRRASPYGPGRYQDPTRPVRTYEPQRGRRQRAEDPVEAAEPDQRQSPAKYTGATSPQTLPPPPPPPNYQGPRPSGPPDGYPGKPQSVYVDPSTGVAMQLVPVPVGQATDMASAIPPQRKMKKRCARYPQCPFGDDCRYIHPSEMCMNWPRCPFGMECFYIHPEVPCKYGVNCLNWQCNYVHPKERSTETLHSRYNAYTGTFRNNSLCTVDTQTSADEQQPTMTEPPQSQPLQQEQEQQQQPQQPVVEEPITNQGG